MPPAFNLSQDQTLQFNHCKKLILTLWSDVVKTSDPRCISVSTSRFRAPGNIEKCTRATTPSAHTYRLFRLLKSNAPKTGREEVELYSGNGSGQQSLLAPRTSLPVPERQCPLLEWPSPVMASEPLAPATAPTRAAPSTTLVAAGIFGASAVLCVAGYLAFTASGPWFGGPQVRQLTRAAPATTTVSTDITRPVADA